MLYSIVLCNLVVAPSLDIDPRSARARLHSPTPAPDLEQSLYQDLGCVADRLQYACFAVNGLPKLELRF